MDIKDFEGLTKYKVIIPTMYVISWISMIIGPIFFNVTYQRVCIFVVFYTTLKVLLLFVIMVIVLIKSLKVLKRVSHPPITQQSNQKQQLDVSQSLLYGFILPSYKQDIEMIAETLDILASHKRARNKYLIFLAMEAHEQNSDKKAQQLMARYDGKFRLINYTRHVVRQYEQKGKASNVSYCAQNLQPFFMNNNIDPQQVFLTILDADSWAPDLYFDVLEEQIIKNYEKRHLIIFQPPQIFTRNNLDVPVTTRVYDLMHSYLHCSNLFSFFGYTFALSNYTLSYNLIKSVGFWDTCADAIGQDFHTCQKIFWKTNGEAKTIPIYVPFNQVNISTDQGYMQDCIARFWQAQRHAQGCADLAWTLKWFLKSKFRPMNFVIFFQIFQTFTLPGFLPWVFLSLMVQQHVLYQGVPKPIELMNPLVLTILFNTLSVFSTLGYFLFQVLKRRANKILYNKENESILRVLEYPIIFSVNLFLISVPTFVIAGFSVLFGKREYIVALKKNTSKNSNASSQ